MPFSAKKISRRTFKKQRATVTPREWEWRTGELLLSPLVLAFLTMSMYSFKNIVFFKKKNKINLSLCLWKHLQDVL